jgi:hypothetical protein
MDRAAAVVEYAGQVADGSADLSGQKAPDILFEFCIEFNAIGHHGLELELYGRRSKAA